jgi:hypothetical protein
MKKMIFLTKNVCRIVLTLCEELDTIYGSYGTANISYKVYDIFLYGMVTN